MFQTVTLICSDLEQKSNDFTKHSLCSIRGVKQTMLIYLSKVEKLIKY